MPKTLWEVFTGELVPQGATMEYWEMLHRRNYLRHQIATSRELDTLVACNLELRELQEAIKKDELCQLASG